MKNDFSLPPDVIASIDAGTISNSITIALGRSEVFKNNDFYVKHKDLIVNYIKAYLVYAICTELSFDIESKTGFTINSEINFMNLENSVKKVESEIAILFDIFDSASKDDSYISAICIKARCDYKNLCMLVNDPRYKKLSVFDYVFKSSIIKLKKIFNFNNIDDDCLLTISKCFLISENNIDDENYLGDSDFIEKMILTAYSLYEDSNIEYLDRIESRNNDRQKIRLLKRIIIDNDFDSR